MCPQCLEDCLVHSRLPVNISGINDWMIAYWYWMSDLSSCTFIHSKRIAERPGLNSLSYCGRMILSVCFRTVREVNPRDLPSDILADTEAFFYLQLVLLSGENINSVGRKFLSHLASGKGKEKWDWQVEQGGHLLPQFHLLLLSKPSLCQYLLLPLTRS